MLFAVMERKKSNATANACKYSSHQFFVGLRKAQGEEACLHVTPNEKKYVDEIVLAFSIFMMSKKKVKKFLSFTYSATI